MGDMGDYWRDHKEYKQIQRNKFRGKNDDCLCRIEKSGHDIRKLSCEHYRINEDVDYWPSTGTWRQKNGKASGWGVASLLKHLNQPSEEVMGR